MQAGGLVGANLGSIATSYATGAVSGTAAIGGLVGQNVGGASVTNAYWDVATSGQSIATGTNNGTLNNVLGIGGSTALDPHQQSTYVGFDFTHTWAIQNGSSRPYLQNVPASHPQP